MSTTILLAEDDRTQAIQIRSLLEREGYRVDVVANGREGLEHVRASRPDLVISDVSMPEMDGYAFCSAVKADEATRSIPFILLTGRSAPSDILEGLIHGADNFISKPCSPKYLLERIRRILQMIETREDGRHEVEVRLSWSDRPVAITADQQQIVELLFSKAEEVSRANAELEESRAALERHASELEEKVQQRTRLLQHALEGYRELVEGTEDMVFACDHHGAISSVNAAACSLLATEDRALIGRPLIALAAPGSERTLRLVIEGAASGGRPCERVELLASDGGAVAVELRLIALLEGGRAVGWQGIARREGPDLGIELSEILRSATALGREDITPEESRALATRIAAAGELLGRLIARSTPSSLTVPDRASSRART